MAGRTWQFRPYVPVGERRAQAAAVLRRRRRRGEAAPVVVSGRAIAHTFWGRAWCENLERYSDFANRLPRGRTYLRNGSVLDLQIGPGTVRAAVAGGALYDVELTLAPLRAPRWRRVVTASAGKIGSIVALLRGELPPEVLATFTHRTDGLFPEPRELAMRCSCPDSAAMCKHVAATLYGVGARLDEAPELFFTLRQVPHADLLAAAGTAAARGAKTKGGLVAGRKPIADEALSAIFGIELATPRRRRHRT
jgi:uncharacterized Zn finger protein